MKKDINGFLKLNHVVSFVPETSKFGNATRLELISSYLRGSANIDYSAPREAKINLKGIYGDASAQLNGKLFQPRNFKYTLNPTKNVSLETDFNKFKIGLIQVFSHSIINCSCSRSTSRPVKQQREESSTAGQREMLRIVSFWR